MSLIIFGATGDLAKSKIIPVLNILGISFLSYGRRDIDDQNYIKGELEEISDKLKDKSISYAYVALPPQCYRLVIEELAKLDPIPRIAIEKPFGASFQNAEELSNLIQKLGIEEKVYLVDHYLAKRAIREHDALTTLPRELSVDLVEKNDVDLRGVFYDQIGTIRDVIQNHVLMIVGEYFGNRKKFLKEAVYEQGSLCLGQYDGYTSINGVSSDSVTETCAQCVLDYQDTKITIRAGKALATDLSKVGDLLISKSDDSYEEIFRDFLANSRRYSVGIDEACDAWRITENILKDKVDKIPVIYPKGSDIMKIWKQ